MGVAVAVTMLAGPMLLLAAVPADTEVPEVSAPADPTTAALDMSAFAARDAAEASRGQARSAATPSVAPEPVPAPTVAAPVAPVEPVAAPAPEVVPPPPPPVPVVTGTRWVTTEVNVRSGPGADTERIGSLATLDQVDITGATADGWTEVVLDGRAGWVNGAYLSETQPAPEAEPAAAADVPGTSSAPCSISTSIERSLSSNASAVYRAVCAAYGGSVSSFGGYRPGDDGDHGSGRAVDIMVSGEAGWEIARFLQARSGDLGISYLIYEQQYWPAGSSAGAWEYMEDRGGATANHYDHVHVSVD